ncbi:transposase [Streptomyces sp. NBC_00723]|uniref:transposase n=1 Tax=Streptomyces sp. NBC_00723 TaxID=2903673 RepID=UPI003869D007
MTDSEWELLAPLIPTASNGRPRAEDRRVVNGMVSKIRTGDSWRDLPRPTPPVTSSGWSRSTPPSFAPTSTRRHRPKRGKHRTDEPDDHALADPEKA